jgi:Uma2 family endonuclease
MVAQDKIKLTLADYHQFIDAPENADRLFELSNGELVEKMPSFLPSEIAGNVIFHLKLFLRERALGRVSGADGGYVMPNGDVLIPDVGFIATLRMPETPEREPLAAPDLAVEMLSPTDRKRALRNKAERYLAHGTAMVWLVFPIEQLVEVYVADADVVTVGIDGVLEGGAVLPGFTLKVSELFA